MDDEGAIFLMYNDTLSCDCEDPKFNLSTYEFEKTFHHEFNHILMISFYDNYNRKERKKFYSFWSEYNQISYSKNEKDKLNRFDNIYKKDTLSDDFFYKMGFISGYASSSIYEDIAEISSIMFMNRMDFWNFIYENKYSIYSDDSDSEKKINPLLRKVKITAEFYNSIDSKFSIEYFKSLK